MSCDAVTVAAGARHTNVAVAAARYLDSAWMGDTTTIVVFAAALLVSPAAGGAMGGVRGGLAALVIAALSVIYGRAVSRWLHLDPRAGYAPLFEAVAGFLSVSLVHLAATAALNVYAVVALAIDVIGAAALVAAARRRTPAASAPVAAPGSSSGRLHLVVLIACAALVAYWSRESLAAVANAQDTGLFNAWRDFLLHASEITYLRDYPAFGAQSPYLSGFPQPLYHRASYAMPALYSALAGVPSLEVATTFWMPNGVLLCAVATYVFGSALGGPVGGAVAVGTVFLLPDASTYGFENRFLSFHWLLQIAGGSGYAIAVTLLACTVVSTSTENRRVAALVGAGALVAAGAAFKVQIALTACGMVALIAVAVWRRVLSRKHVVSALAIVVLLAGLAVWMESRQMAPQIFARRANPVAFLEFVHRQAAGLWSIYTWLTGNRGDIWKFLAGYALFLPAMLGVILPAVVAISLTGTRARVRWPPVAIPVALILSHVSVTLLVPTPSHGDVTEAGHRSFVLIYAVLGATVGAAAARVLTELSIRWFRTERIGLAALCALGLTGLAVPHVIGRDVQQRWSPRSAAVPIGRDAFGAGTFVRNRSNRGEQVLAATEDPLAAYVALTERGAFLARRDLFRRVGADAAAIVNARSVEHASLTGVSTFEALQAFGRRSGVGWYIADTAATRLWPGAIRERCSYCGETIQVYDLR